MATSKNVKQRERIPVFYKVDWECCMDMNLYVVNLLDEFFLFTDTLRNYNSVFSGINVTMKVSDRNKSASFFFL
jgi:hypothetical protein